MQLRLSLRLFRAEVVCARVLLVGGLDCLAVARREELLLARLEGLLLRALLQDARRVLLVEREERRAGEQLVRGGRCNHTPSVSEDLCSTSTRGRLVCLPSLPSLTLSSPASLMPAARWPTTRSSFARRTCDRTKK